MVRRVDRPRRRQRYVVPGDPLRATWIRFGNKGDLELLVEGDPRLFNQYGVILVNPQRFPHVKADSGQQFIDWLLSEKGQRLIAGYRIDGQPAFFVDAGLE